MRVDMVTRRTTGQIAVLDYLLTRPDTEHYGFEIIRATGLKSGVLYPMLKRFEDAGWVASRWEQLPSASPGRPARRLVRLTDKGKTGAAKLLDRETTP